jgi:carbamoyltransferase
MKNKNKAIIGLSTFVHDSSSCLVNYEGKVLYASAEERFSNLKSDSHIPFFTLKKCIDIAKEKNLKVEKIAVAYDPNLFLGEGFSKKIHFILNDKKIEKKFTSYLLNFNSGKFFNMIFNNKFIKNFFVKNNFYINSSQERKIFEYLTYFYNSMIKYEKVNKIISNSFPQYEIVNVRHHLAHAVSAYFNSGFKNSNILVMDGKGEDDTITLFNAKNNRIKEISKTSWPVSMGYFYQLVTFTLNYTIGDEFKVMGMSAYGKNKFLKYFKDCFRVNNNGKVNFFENEYLKIKDFPNTKYEQLYFTNKFLNKIGKVNKNKFNQKHFDLAKSTQTLIENIGLKLSLFIKNKKLSQNLCISGGCALNGLMNNHILINSKYKNIYVFSASGDDGTSVGAAQYILMKNNLKNKRKKIDNVFLGHDDLKIKDKSYIEKKLSNNLEIMDIDDIYKFSAEQISENKVIAIFNGPSEFGPRALGNRSIIANALNPNIKKDLNIKIKLREPFRPFAPIILKSDTKKYFKLKKDSEYMLFICDTVKRYRNKIPGVVHKDNTARVQTVDKSNYVFYKILKEFKKITKIPVMINTSFNIGGEAIVETIDDAINSFNQMDIDYLLIGNFLIKKKLKLPIKDTKSFIENRKKIFTENNRYKRIDLTRLNYNFYIKESKIIKEKAKDILKKTIKGGNFIS